MATYRIHSKDGSDFGFWNADSPEAAFDLMADDAGRGIDDAGNPTEGTAEDWEITEVTTDDLVLCESADGWSLHAPGSTDEQIATGYAPYLVSGEGEPTEADYAEALAKL